MDKTREEARQERTPQDHESDFNSGLHRPADPGKRDSRTRPSALASHTGMKFPLIISIRTGAAGSFKSLAARFDGKKNGRSEEGSSRQFRFFSHDLF